MTRSLPAGPNPRLLERVGTQRIPPVLAGGTPAPQKQCPGYVYEPLQSGRKLSVAMFDVSDAGMLTTASDLLFTGGREGYFFALDAMNGALLWKIQLGGPIQNGPMTYSVDGKQYVGVLIGGGAGALTNKSPELKNLQTAAMLYVFAL